MLAVHATVKHVQTVQQYRHASETLIEFDKAPRELSEDTVRFISAEMNEPAWVLEWRLEALRRWLIMTEPTWVRVNCPKLDYQGIGDLALPKLQKRASSTDEINPETLKSAEKRGDPMGVIASLEGPGAEPPVDREMTVNTSFDSLSVATPFRQELKKAGVIFMPISQAIGEHPELVRKYLGSVVPISDNFFARLNSAVFSDGSFVYVPPGVRCPMELSTMNGRNSSQFERTLIIADQGSYVSYSEGCTARQQDESELQASVVELVVLDDAEIKYSTVQNARPGKSEGNVGIYNFATKRCDCRGKNSKVSWTRVETVPATAWKSPSCILRGDNSRGEFYSIAMSTGFQQVDSGLKMIHLGKNTSSRILTKRIAAGRSQNTYRGLVSVHLEAEGARSHTACNSLLIGEKSGVYTVPYVEAKNSSATIEHEATISKISDDVLFYCVQRGIRQGDAVGLIVNGFARDVLHKLPLELAVEVQRLIWSSLQVSNG